VQPEERLSGVDGEEADDRPSGRELALLAESGGAFDWLDEEPDLYSVEDGEPV
jgi:hypothetical protein